MPQTFQCLIVGSHFRPPAKLLLSSVPTGTALSLELEPDNAYDPQAVKVLLDPSAVPAGQRDNLTPALEGYGTNWEDLLANGPRHVGYVQSTVSAKQPLPAGFTTAKTLQPLLLASAGCETSVLQFTPAGAPMLTLELP